MPDTDDAADPVMSRASLSIQSVAWRLADASTPRTPASWHPTKATTSSDQSPRASSATGASRAVMHGSAEPTVGAWSLQPSRNGLLARGRALFACASGAHMQPLDEAIDVHSPGQHKLRIRVSFAEAQGPSRETRNVSVQLDIGSLLASQVSSPILMQHNVCDCKYQMQP